MRCRGMEKHICDFSIIENLIENGNENQLIFNINGDNEFNQAQEDIDNECSFNEIIAKIIDTFDYMCEFIKANKLAIEKYDLIFDKLNLYKKLLAVKMEIDLEYEPTFEESRDAFYRHYEYINDCADRDDLLEQINSQVEEQRTELSDDDLFYFSREIIDDIVIGERTCQNKHFEQYSRLSRYAPKLFTFANNDSNERSLQKAIFDYKPTKEQRLETYFKCDNYKALKSILHRELQGKGGIAVAKVLTALSNAGCKIIDNKFDPLFENVLTPIYGVIGRRYSISKHFEPLNNVTEKNDKKTATEIALLTEKFKKELE